MIDRVRKELRAAAGTKDPLMRRQQDQMANQFRKCRLEDKAKLDFCLLKMLTDIRPQFRVGIPEVNVPRLDPMVIPNILVEESVPLVKITAQFMQVVVEGASSFQPTNVHAEPDIVFVSMVIPELHINGLYTINGNVMLLPLHGNGTFWVLLNDIQAHTSTNLLVQRNHLQVLRTNIQFNVGKIQLRLNNLFGGNNFIGETVNRALNENSQQILDSVKPRIAERISEAVRNILNEAFSNLPANAFVS
uniref:Lipid-binding serum glycoprotein N-terminal domain-containing protein n=1 Tax=Strigamia maritima TaxID=126957 RepID=T1J7V9_STRMM